MIGLTEEQKVRVRHHCGYLNVQEAMTFVLGTPAGVETQFIIEGAMNRIMDAAIPQLLRHLAILDTIEEQMVCDLELLAVEELDSIKINPQEQEKLTRRYNYWVSSMCNIMGVERNPFDKRLVGIGNSSINVRVVG